VRLLGWLDGPDERRGIRFARPGGDWEFWSYARLAGLARDLASGLLARSHQRGDVVSIVHRSGPEFVAGLFGTLLAGGTPSPVAPPGAYTDSAAYQAHLHGLFSAARPRTVLCEPQLAEEVGPVAAAAGVPTVSTVDDLLAAAGGFSRPEPAELALVQFTSGSSGVANGVRVRYPTLEANLAAISSWLRMTSEDPTASWLPVHHDMGLIGCLLTPVVNQTDLWLLSPEDFVRSPARYLRCFGVEGARLTAMPNFGVGYLARRVRPADLTGCDFSAWRSIIVGAERIDREALDRAYQLLGPFGLRREAFLPAYGLAEATVAVTGLPLPEVYRSVRVRPESLTPGQPAEEAEAGQEITGCGRPLDGVQVSIVDDSDAELPDWHVGQIVVRGSSVADGYLGTPRPGQSSRLRDGTLWSGDAGFLVDGQLFVLGRLGDSMKVRGRTVFAEDLEELLGDLRAPARRLMVVLGESGGTPTVVVVFDRAREDWLSRTPRLLKPRIADAELVLADVPRGVLRWTSSGKPRRRSMWDAYLRGELDAP